MKMSKTMRKKSEKQHTTVAKKYNKYPEMIITKQENEV